MGGGAWPFLVGGLICLVNSDNERDHSLLNSNQNKYLKRSEGWEFSLFILLGLVSSKVRRVSFESLYLFSDF